MFDAEDVHSVLTSLDESVMTPLDDLLNALEQNGLADEDGDLEDDEILEEAFEDLSSSSQKKVEAEIRKGLAKIRDGALAVLEEIEVIDNALLDQDVEGEDEESQEDEDDDE